MRIKAESEDLHWGSAHNRGLKESSKTMRKKFRDAENNAEEDLRLTENICHQSYILHYDYIVHIKCIWILNRDVIDGRI